MSTKQRHLICSVQLNIGRRSDMKTSKWRCLDGSSLHKRDEKGRMDEQSVQILTSILTSHVNKRL